MEFTEKLYDMSDQETGVNLSPGAVRRAHPAAPLKDFQEIPIIMI